ncbi:MAG TPA: sugar ABC transporter substrate-binding protein [Chthoniobacterales bacterium]|jgi:simple sugar transport system substrate-binding protein|nr:sugar ABC transporter substrate-binding protein [Chthoniobacterales bacterium]
MKKLERTSSLAPVCSGVSRREALRRAAGAGALLSLSSLAGFTVSSAEAAEEATGRFPKHPVWKFVFVNHVTTNPFFVPTRYGAEDACALLNCTYQWTGSEKSIATDMVNALNTAVSAKADGIAVSLVDLNAFNDPVEKALAAGIPVVSYNADAKDNKRLCYIGQDLFLSGKGLGQRIVELVGEGPVAGFIATPGQLNIQPRMDGAREAIKQSGKNIQLEEIATGPTVNEELSRIQAYFTGHQDVKGMFAVDAGSTEGVAKVMAANKLASKGVHAGGFDLLPTTLDAISKGDLDFTIDQQPYLQGFYTVMVLFMTKISGGLTGPADINTGLKFVTKSNVGPYLTTKSRYEGSSSEEKVLTPGKSS